MKIINYLTILSIALFTSACANLNHSMNYTGDANVAYLDLGNQKNSPSYLLQGNEIFKTPNSEFSSPIMIKSVPQHGKKIVPSNTKIVWQSEKLFPIAINNKNITLPSSIKKEKTHPWDAAHQLFLEKTKRGEPVVAVEPDFDYIGNKKLLEETDLTDENSTIAIEPSDYWPSENSINWHQGNNFTGLAIAREITSNFKHHKPIVIAHLDTGYNPNDKLIPPKFNKSKSSDFVSNSGGIDDKPAGHGVRTLSSLAGGKINVSAIGYKYDDYLGGNPYAEVFEYRIHKSSPVHFNSKNMAKAIISAVKNDADIISLSAGGFPTFLQRDAVNDAYENGTAIIAATGNHYVVPIVGWHTPNMVGFPARYNRVLAVAGVTYDKKPYTDAPCYFCLLTHWPWDWGSWMLRGNAGPASVMANKSISAYSPNIAYSAPTKSNLNRIGLDGGGASHATTQVAAAASIWLQNNRKELEDINKWRSWEKVEAVYQALMQSANDSVDLKHYSLEKMGEGVLRADQALTFSFDEISNTDKFKHRKKSRIGGKWVLELFTRSKIPYISSFANESVTKMLGLELSQVVYLDKSLYDDYLEVEKCLETGRNASSCTSVKTSFLKKVIKVKNISNYLKESIKKELA